MQSQMNGTNEMFVSVLCLKSIAKTRTSVYDEFLDLCIIAFLGNPDMLHFSNSIAIVCSLEIWLCWISGGSRFPGTNKNPVCIHCRKTYFPISISKSCNNDEQHIFVDFPVELKYWLSGCGGNPETRIGWTCKTNDKHFFQEFVIIRIARCSEIPQSEFPFKTAAWRTKTTAAQQVASPQKEKLAEPNSMHRQSLGDRLGWESNRTRRLKHTEPDFEREPYRLRHWKSNLWTWHLNICEPDKHVDTSALLSLQTYKISWTWRIQFEPDNLTNRTTCSKHTFLWTGQHVWTVHRKKINGA